MNGVDLENHTKEIHTNIL